MIREVRCRQWRIIWACCEEKYTWKLTDNWQRGRQVNTWMVWPHDIIRTRIYACSETGDHGRWWTVTVHTYRLTQDGAYDDDHCSGKLEWCVTRILSLASFKCLLYIHVRMCSPSEFTFIIHKYVMVCISISQLVLQFFIFVCDNFVSGGAWVFEFALKFYPPDPSQLRESLTR